MGRGSAPAPAAGGGGGSFPSGTSVTVTVSGYFGSWNGETFSLCPGDGALHSWGFANFAGGGGNDTAIDDGGGPTDDDMATRIKTRIDALADADMTVVRALNVLTITHADEIVVYSSSNEITIT